MITRTIVRPTVSQPATELEPEQALVSMAQDIAAMQARAGCRVSIGHDGLIHVVSDEAVVTYETGVTVSPYWV